MAMTEDVFWDVTFAKMARLCSSVSSLFIYILKNMAIVVNFNN